MSRCSRQQNTTQLKASFSSFRRCRSHRRHHHLCRRFSILCDINQITLPDHLTFPFSFINNTQSVSSGATEDGEHMTVTLNPCRICYPLCVYTVHTVRTPLRRHTIQKVEKSRRECGSRDRINSLNTQFTNTFTWGNYDLTLSPEWLGELSNYLMSMDLYSHFRERFFFSLWKWCVCVCAFFYLLPGDVLPPSLLVPMHICKVNGRCETTRSKSGFSECVQRLLSEWIWIRFTETSKTFKLRMRKLLLPFYGFDAISSSSVCMC